VYQLVASSDGLFEKASVFVGHDTDGWTELASLSESHEALSYCQEVALYHSLDCQAGCCQSEYQAAVDCCQSLSERRAEAVALAALAVSWSAFHVSCVVHDIDRT
jgi:hypothetical protein